LALLGVIHRKRIFYNRAFCSRNLSDPQPKPAYLTSFIGFEELQERLPSFFRDRVGSSENELIESASKLIANLAKDASQSLGYTCGLVSVRVTHPEKWFEMARWHLDGRISSAADQVKFVAVLKGPSTRFAKLDNEHFAKYKTMEFKPQCREAISQLVAENGQEQRAVIGQAAWFSVTIGQGALHSEPDLTEDRLFLSVVPMTCEDLALQEEEEKNLEGNYPQVETYFRAN
jgi:hypothetical protein